MVKYFPYALLFVAMVLFQLFLFDNLQLGTFLNPLVYVAFIILLPLDAKPVTILLSGLLIGVVMDLTMGAAGLNTIATLAVAFLRPALLGLIYGRDDAREAGVPSPERLGMRKFIEYLVAVVLLHHALFFLLEALSWEHLLHTLLRIVLSALLTLGFVWLTARIFTAKTSTRIL